MSLKPQTFVLALSICLILGLGVIPAAAQEENPTAVQSDALTPGAVGNSNGYPDSYAGDYVVGKRAKTSDDYQYFYESYRKYGYNYKNLKNGYVDVYVPAGQTHLVNIAFSAECRLFEKKRNNDYKNDYKKYNDSDALLIKLYAQKYYNGYPTKDYAYPTPNDGGQAFCSDDGYATHKGNWVVLLYGDATWRIHVSFLVYDKKHNDKLYGYIDDWTLEAVSYYNGRKVY
jgi:hypothetical protein